VADHGAGRSLSSSGDHAADERVGDIAIVPIQLRAVRSALSDSPRCERAGQRRRGPHCARRARFAGLRFDLGRISQLAAASA
jgi:hypothetical protein